ARPARPMAPPFLAERVPTCHCRPARHEVTQTSDGRPMLKVIHVAGCPLADRQKIGGNANHGRRSEDQASNAHASNDAVRTAWIATSGFFSPTVAAKTRVGVSL